MRVWVDGRLNVSLEWATGLFRLANYAMCVSPRSHQTFGKASWIYGREVEAARGVDHNQLEIPARPIG